MPETGKSEQQPDEVTRLKERFQRPKGINASISVNIDMSELENWEPQRLQALFRGVAEVIAAGKTELGS